jgi:hypothetical protein
MIDTTNILKLNGSGGPEIFANRCAYKVAWKEAGILENFYIINPGDWVRKTQRAPFTHRDDIERIEKIRSKHFNLNLISFYAYKFLIICDRLRCRLLFVSSQKTRRHMGFMQRIDK